MKFTLGLTFGITLALTLCIVWHHTWRPLLGWALSRGDQPSRL